MRSYPRLTFVVVSATLLAQVPSSNANVPVCAIAGQGYDDPLVTSVNGGTGLADSTQCQSKCALQSNCSVFTFYSNSGSCWLQGSGLTAEAMPGAISGPRHCDHAPAPVAAATTSLVSQQRHYLRFIEASGETLISPKVLYFQDGSRTHLVRTPALCYSCQSACSVKTEVTRAYIASLEQREDFDCNLLRTTTTQAVGVYISDEKKESLHETIQRERDELALKRNATKEDAGPGPWPWILAAVLLLCCCIAVMMQFDKDHNRKTKHKSHKDHHRREQHEGLPLMAAGSNQTPFSSTTSSARGGPGGPGAMPTQAQFNTQLPTQAQFNVNTSRTTFAA